MPSVTPVSRALTPIESQLFGAIHVVFQYHVDLSDLNDNQFDVSFIFCKLKSREAVEMGAAGPLLSSFDVDAAACSVCPGNVTVTCEIEPLNVKRALEEKGFSVRMCDSDRCGVFIAGLTQTPSVDATSQQH